jgi:hypothetical protein
MDLQRLLVGGLFFAILVSALLTAPLSLFLLWLYRRAVLRGMNVVVGARSAAQPPDPKAAPALPLQITDMTLTSRPAAAVGADLLDREVTRSLRRLMLAYTAAGLGFAAVFAAASSIQAGGGFYPIRFLVLMVNYSWPIVFALSLLAALGWRDRLEMAALYLILATLLGVIGYLGSVDQDPWSLVVLWLIGSGPTTLLLIASLARRIRAVGPMVLAFLTAGMIGATVLTAAVGSSDPTMRGLVDSFGSVGLGAVEIFVCINLAGFVLLGVAGWGLLRVLGRRYRLKRLSDQSLTLDAVWLMFAVTNSILLATEGWMWILTALVAFGAYKLILWLALAWLVRPAVAATQRRPMLLLLRVFSLGPRSLRLFDALTKYWLRAGPIVLIAGPDLVTGIVEPPEFLDFVGGHVSRRFVQGEEDLAHRLAQLDTGPDPDGRYRVSDFFCRADTWQMTMQQLAVRSDAVLMDLRSFSPTNQGCLYELGQLLDAVSLPQVLLIVDATTDVAFLKESLQSLWQGVSAGSPNRRLREPEVRLFEAKSGVGAEVRTLLRLLFGQAQAQGVTLDLTSTPSAG